MHNYLYSYPGAVYIAASRVVAWQIFIRHPAFAPHTEDIDMSFRSTLLLLLLVIASSGLCAQQTLPKARTENISARISPANLTMWFSNNGILSYDRLRTGAGLEWPTGSGKYLAFTEGLLFGCRNPEPSVGGANYISGLQPGNILASRQASDPADPAHRIYKVRRMDRAYFENLNNAEQTHYILDFQEWPVHLGAPWIDGNGNGIYEPDFDAWLAGTPGQDSPKFPGTEAAWFVANDLDTARTRKLHGSNPVGVEIRMLIWGSSEMGFPANTLVRDVKLINRSGATLHDVYLSWWVDPEVGDAMDDFVGIDTIRNMAYAYNGRESDNEYGVPPAVGWKLLQGPVVRDPNSIALYDYTLRRGYRNLPLSSFVHYISGSSVYRDAEFGSEEGTAQCYNNMKGLRWDGAPFIDPVSAQQSSFLLSGNPLTGSGWVDGIVHAPSDRRMMMSTGPFTLADGEEQQMIIGAIAAQDSTRLASLDRLFRHSDELAPFLMRYVTSASAPAPTPHFAIADVFPQPASDRITVRYAIDSPQHIALDVYDMLGRRQVRQLDLSTTAGSHSSAIVTAGWAPGMYILRMQGAQGNVSRRIIIR
jgi:hypothetical protein